MRAWGSDRDQGLRDASSTIPSPNPINRRRRKELPPGGPQSRVLKRSRDLFTRLMVLGREVKRFGGRRLPGAQLGTSEMESALRVSAPPAL